MNRRALFIFVLFPAVVLSAAAWGEPARVGRVSFVEGDVSFAAGDDGSWAPASLNYPLTTSDRLSTGGSSRAEAHVGSTAIRLAPDSAMTFEALDDTAVRVRLDKGSLSVRVRHLDPDQRMAVDARVASVVLGQAGSYRVDQRDDGSAAVTVRRGSAQVTTGAGSFTALSGQTAEIPQSDPSAWRISAAAGPDSWDDWVASRDNREDDVSSARYVSREMDGVEDLDQFGSWRVIAGFGPCWVPFVAAAGWAPYRLGRWAWIEPWGWTWIDNAPWGFAPFHYGRWIVSAGVWAWVPGPIVARPVFRPAQVSWVGGVPDRDRMPDGRHIRWVPLRPHEPFRPAAVPVARAPFGRPAYPAPAVRGTVYPAPTLRAPAFPAARVPLREPPRRVVVPIRGPAPRGPAASGDDDPEIRKWRHDH